VAYVASKQLSAARYTDNANHDVYTCPSQRRTIVKGLLLYNSHAGAAFCTMLILKSGITNAGAQVYYMAAAGSAGDGISVQPWFVLEVGDVLRFKWSTTDGGYVVVSGAELEL
jgi:hypothetical protein